jgi:hypothetical protein
MSMASVNRSAVFRHKRVAEVPGLVTSYCILCHGFVAATAKRDLLKLTEKLHQCSQESMSAGLKKPPTIGEIVSPSEFGYLSFMRVGRLQLAASFTLYACDLCLTA